MKYLFFLLTIIAVVSCKKEDPEEQARVTYKVTETASSGASFSVTYSAENNSTRTEGPITGSSWSSSVVRDKKRGDFVSLTLESTSAGSFTMQIYMNSVLWQEKQVSNPYSAVTLSGNLPQ